MVIYVFSISRIYWSVENPRRRVVYKCRVFISNPNRQCHKQEDGSTSTSQSTSIISNDHNLHAYNSLKEQTLAHESSHPDYSFVIIIKFIFISLL